MYSVYCENDTKIKCFAVTDISEIYLLYVFLLLRLSSKLLCFIDINISLVILVNYFELNLSGK